MKSAKEHLNAASAHMALAEHRADDADLLMSAADEQLVIAAAKLAEAQSDSDEYQRALFHYTNLVRHRMANPLQVIAGMAITLRSMPDLPRNERVEMIDAICQQAEILERVCLDPAIMHASEHDLDPVPSVHPPRG
jgi:signal transduction histidine kinase